MQTKCLRLMGKKLLVALTIEGKFAAEGLHDIEDDDDMLSAMARELVEKDGIGETADQVWSQLKEVYDQLPTASQHTADVEDEQPVLEDQVIEYSEAMVVMDELPSAEMLQPGLLGEQLSALSVPTLFGQTLPSMKRKGKRTREADPLQGSLFTWN